MARQKVHVFITLLLHRFQTGLASSSNAFPRFDLTTPTTGIISPKIGDDVVVILEEEHATIWPSAGV